MLPDFVFGYDSLSELVSDRRLPRDYHPEGFIADLRDHRRVWGVAMDNTLALPDYKYYTDALTGERIDGCVAFLDVVEAPGCTVNGVCLPVDASVLAALDQRERNYDRIDASDLFPDVPARLWMYRGKSASRSRRDAAMCAGRLYVQQAYVERCQAGFAALGTSELERYLASTASLDGMHVAELDRHDLS